MELFPKAILCLLCICRVVGVWAYDNFKIGHHPQKMKSAPTRWFWRVIWWAIQWYGWFGRKKSFWGWAPLLKKGDKNCFSAFVRSGVTQSGKWQKPKSDTFRRSTLVAQHFRLISKTCPQTSCVGRVLCWASNQGIVGHKKKLLILI